MDLMQLEDKYPTVWNESLKGHFVTQKKSSHKFSMMAHDHIHEQLNAVVKGDGGIIEITENESTLWCWMIAGPEVARIVGEVSLKQLKITRVVTMNKIQAHRAVLQEL